MKKYLVLFEPAASQLSALATATQAKYGHTIEQFVRDAVAGDSAYKLVVADFDAADRAGSLAFLDTQEGLLISESEGTEQARMAAKPNGSSVDFVYSETGAKPSDIVQALKDELPRLNSDPIGRPLPFACEWNTGSNTSAGFTAAYIFEQMARGHYVWPAFSIGLNPLIHDPLLAKKQIARLNLPLALLFTQPEARLYDASGPYFGLAEAQNPNVIRNSDDVVLAKVDPEGPTQPWTDVGDEWGSTALLSTWQQIYPEPPLVYFVSNNEASRLRPNEAETESKRFIANHGTGNTEEFIREVIGDGLVTRMSLLITAWKAALTSNWSAVSKFIGWNATGPTESMGRFFGWASTKLHLAGPPVRFNEAQEYFDGAELRAYVTPGVGDTDFWFFSPMTVAQNYHFAKAEAEAHNPEWLNLLSVWDGGPGKWGFYYGDRVPLFGGGSHSISPKRWAGAYRFSMWQHCPRYVRNFRASTETVAEFKNHFREVMEAVDEVHLDATLASWWRASDIVANTAVASPYDKDVPSQYSATNRWYQLDIDLDPARPWDITDPPPLDVLALARVRGTAPNREWLVYAYAPQADDVAASVTIPGHKAVSIIAARGGSFWLVDEALDTVTEHIPAPNRPKAAQTADVPIVGTITGGV